MKDSQKIFQIPKEIKIAIALQNVGHGVLDAASSQTQDKVQGHYGARVGFLPIRPGLSSGVLILHPTNTLTNQISYLAATIGHPISIFETLPENPHVLVPYIVKPQQELGANHQTYVWGPHHTLVENLKDKATFHHLAQELAVKGFETPDFDTCDLDHLIETGSRCIKEYQLLYQKADMASLYPVGLFIRSSRGDGGYGTVKVIAHKGQFAVLPDAQWSKVEFRSTLNEALALAKKVLGEKIDENKNNRVVITRAMDLESSPGLSVFIANGKITSLGWNGQLQDNNSSACVGTSTFNPQTKLLAQFQAEYESQTEEAFANFIQKVCKNLNLDPHSLTGFLNIDLMIPGAKERELQKRLGQKPKILIAEVNPRITNYTDLILLMILVLGKEQTVKSMYEVISQGLLAYDSFAVLPSHLTMPEFTDKIFNLNHKLRSRGTGAVALRMPDPSGLGIAISGDTAHIAKKVRQLLKYNK